MPITHSHAVPCCLLGELLPAWGKHRILCPCPLMRRSLHPLSARDLCPLARQAWCRSIASALCPCQWTGSSHCLVNMTQNYQGIILLIQRHVAPFFLHWSFHQGGEILFFMGMVPWRIPEINRQCFLLVVLCSHPCCSVTVPSRLSWVT